MKIVREKTFVGNEFMERKELALDEYRAGNLKEARARILELFVLTRTDYEFMSQFVNLAMIERGMGNHREAFAIYAWAGYLLDGDCGDFQKGNYYYGRAVNHEETGDPDAALVDYAAAKDHYLKAQDYRYISTVENNVAFILLKKGLELEALESLWAVRKQMESYGETVIVAKIDITIAQAYQKLGDYKSALNYALQSILVLQNTDELLAWSKSVETYIEIYREMKSV